MADANLKCARCNIRGPASSFYWVRGMGWCCAQHPDEAHPNVLKEWFKWAHRSTMGLAPIAFPRARHSSGRCGMISSRKRNLQQQRRSSDARAEKNGTGCPFPTSTTASSSAGDVTRCTQNTLGRRMIEW